MENKNLLYSAIACLVVASLLYCIYRTRNLNREGYFRDPYPVGIAAYNCYENAVKRGYPKYKLCPKGDTCNNSGKCCNSGQECSPKGNFSCDEEYFVRTY